MSLLQRAYPLYNLHNICRYCKGNPKVFQKKPKCAVCKLSRMDYVRRKMENECNEIIYLYQTWLKVRNFRQASTGVKIVDDVIIYLFGIPYPDFFEHKRKCREIAGYKEINRAELEKLTLTF